MRLRKALGISRIFVYKGKKYFATVYPREKFWTRKKFIVLCSEHPMPDSYFEFSSEIDVKPVIRENANPQQD